MSPNQPREGTSVRTFRMPDDLWTKAQAKARERDETVSDVVRRALERYAAGKL